jgi:ABC-type antimicrobial peptide transport system permease subunit
MSGFAALALLLGAVGIFGVVSYAVVARTREIGIRLALGAAPARVLGSVLVVGLVPVVGGALAGLLAGVLFAREILGGLLFDVQPQDPASGLLVVGILLVVAALAALVPARHATRIHPLEALRRDS